MCAHPQHAGTNEIVGCALFGSICNVPHDGKLCCAALAFAGHAGDQYGGIPELIGADFEPSLARR